MKTIPSGRSVSGSMFSISVIFLSLHFSVITSRIRKRAANTRLLTIIACGLLFVGVIEPAVADGKKIALVVGVEHYDPDTFTRLQYAEDDAVALERALVAIGFDVICMTSQATIPARKPIFAKDILDQLERRLKNRDADDVVLLFFSGHGIQLKSDPTAKDGSKETYFCPERADTSDKSTLVPFSVVMDRLADCRAGRKVLLVDACRNDVVPKESKKGFSDLGSIGVERPPVPKGMIALFSCSPKETSHEFADLGHGVFTNYVLEYLNGTAVGARYPKQELRITEMAAFVSRETGDYIDRKLGKSQSPQLMSSGIADWPLGKLAFDPFAGKTTGEGKELVPGMKFRWCPPGSFTMGTASATNDEAPVQVTLSKGFWMGETEVTQGQWESLMQTTPWRGQLYVKEGAEYAASYISHGDAGDGKLGADSAAEFCRRLTELERQGGRLPPGWKYGLPTEAQWEYSCRAGTTTKYSFGDDEGRIGDYAWHQRNTYLAGELYTHLVRQKKPNAWGLFDMHGNAAEWCADWYEPKLVGGRNPTGLSKGLQKVIRGGGANYLSVDCRAASRRAESPNFAGHDHGFRVAGVPSSE